MNRIIGENIHSFGRLKWGPFRRRQLFVDVAPGWRQRSQTKCAAKAGKQCVAREVRAAASTCSWLARPGV